VLDSGLAVRPSEGRQGHDRVREGGAAIDLDVPAANLWDSHGSPPSRRQQSGAGAPQQSMAALGPWEPSSSRTRERDGGDGSGWVPFFIYLVSFFFRVHVTNRPWVY
jgi:hypothetical protein